MTRASTPPGSAPGRPRLHAHGVQVDVDAARLLEDIDLRLEPGTLVGIVGPNGAGKSTLLRVLAGVLPPSAGAVHLDGRDLRRVPKAEAARAVASVPQSAPPTYGFTTEELVVMGRYPHLRRFQVEGAEDHRAARQAMRDTGIEHLRGRVVASLSGGERQRALLARALAQQAGVLLLDEPAANLDIRYQVRVLRLVRALADQGVAAVAAIHDLSLAARYCDRLVLLSQGRLVAHGAPATVLTREHLTAAYDIPVLVHDDPVTGRPVIDLHDGLDAADDPSPPGAPPGRVHVICGYGTGAELLRALHHRGHTVTAGPLGRGDVDRITAEALGIDYLPVPGPTPIDDATDTRHRHLVAAAPVTLLCPFPPGPANLVSLRAATHARHLVLLQPDGQQPAAADDARMPFGAEHADLPGHAVAPDTAAAIRLVEQLLAR